MKSETVAPARRGSRPQPGGAEESVSAPEARKPAPAPTAARLGAISPPLPANEPVLSYAPGSTERAELWTRIEEMRAGVVEIPLVIGGEEVRSGDLADVVEPHAHGRVLARFHRAGAEEAKAAVEAARKAWREWSSWPQADRAAVFLRAAELLAGTWRATVNAATMLGQSKTAHQAEIDSACELIDFWRFNVHFADRILTEQPASAPGEWNVLDHRPLEGFVYAITPFNFTSIGGNLPTAPAIVGNVSIWKPATTAVLSSYYIMRLLQEAGLPPGVLNFLPGRSAEISEVLLASPELAGIHFTGSTGTFQLLWRGVAEHLAEYRSYPRVVGETGGKDFILAHASADPAALTTAIVRGGFEYQGQKCSAVSRVYVPGSAWPEVRERLEAELASVRVGDPTEPGVFMGAVIDDAAYRSITGYIEEARRSEEAEILIGGDHSDETGYFIQPTVVRARDPRHRLMCEEIFGPVVTVHVYPDARWAETLELVDGTSPYALTGAVFARDRAAIREALAGLRHAAGNFYVNDKPTGAVVGRQPFGGGRASGTNDKAGSLLNLQRWISPRSIKETFVPPTDWRYPFLEEE